jgi:nucleotide-binding universal stress UspA family protein
VAARYALALARACQAKLSLVFASEEGTGRDVLRRAESALERLFIDAESAGIEVESVVEKGDPSDKISEQVAEHGIDIVFAATRREDVEKRFFARTVARKLMLKLPCSVVMVRVVRMGRPAPGNILVPMGGRAADLDERAFFVAKLAQGLGSKVTLFHMPKPMSRFFHGEVHLKPVEREERLPKDVHDFVETLHRFGIPHEKKTAHGHVARSITAEAAAGRNDLVVMGASQRGLLGKVVGISPVEDVLRETRCNLMIIRPRHERPQPRKG